MEAISRMLPLSASGKFRPELGFQLRSHGPLVFEENLPASYILRQPHEYTHNPTRAGICVTTNYRLVIVASGQKKVDVPLLDSRWMQGITITQDKTDRIIFKIVTGTYGPGTQGSTLEIRVRTPNARQILGIFEEARRQTARGGNGESSQRGHSE